MADTFLVPRIESIEQSGTYGKFVVEPLERGFATTLGNALRRVLLSSISGAAVTAIKVEKVLHEFSTIPGVKEDTTELILNIKELAVRAPGSGRPNEVITLTIDTRGPGVVTGADVRCPDDVEIANPEVYLATISEEGASLRMELYVQRGRGYVAPEKVTLPDSLAKTIGVIPIGAMFSPVRKVNYIVESTRVGFKTDLERLTLEIWTNGTIYPVHALQEAARILREFIDMFVRMDAGSSLPPPQESSLLPTNVPDVRVEELDFSVRTYNCLKRAGISNVRDLVHRTHHELMSIRNFGKRSLYEVREKLAQLGLTLRGETLEQVRAELAAAASAHQDDDEESKE
ncbi:MAG: DNA-directed RNA polymerase subunit alpha [Armatimonadota bacterium]|nr:DNA-directed RNA polymerase subunit alpha [bacterium]MCS7308894.1 DNA-directed RNA polymerase subunit alpha [Armatimonadota bacterium]MDW8103532.1 DNA-directed RNA polymerase subunit alpha [Armatimonadota bacterium]MDW8289486.1 DNA-directed RNA polymerase subunit alpha [Armatimonadota bacterium]